MLFPREAPGGLVDFTRPAFADHQRLLVRIAQHALRLDALRDGDIWWVLGGEGGNGGVNGGEPIEQLPPLCFEVASFPIHSDHHYAATASVHDLSPTFQPFRG